MGNKQGLLNEKSRTTPDIPLLERNAFFVPLPIIVLFNNDRIVDFNLAAKNLFGSCIDACRSQNVTKLLKDICEQLPTRIMLSGGH